MCVFVGINGLVCETCLVTSYIVMNESKYD